MLTFEQFQATNVARCNTDYKPLTSWSPCEWTNALAGEVGEACNLTKKMLRIASAPELVPAGRHAYYYSLVELLGEELADIVIYASLTASRLGLSLEDLIRHKFNKKSEEIGSKFRL